MKQRNFTCDRCKKEWQVGEHSFDVPQDKVLWDVELVVTNPTRPSFGLSRKFKVEWCTECVIGQGIAIPTKGTSEEKIPINDPKPTFEDLLRQIVRDEIEEQD